MAGRRPTATVIGIAGELVKGATSTTTMRRDDPRSPLGEPELERLVTRAQESALREAEEPDPVGVRDGSARRAPRARGDRRDADRRVSGQQPDRLHRRPGRAAPVQRLRADGPPRRAPVGRQRARRSTCSASSPSRMPWPRAWIRASWATAARCSSTSAAGRPTSRSSVAAASAARRCSRSAAGPSRRACRSASASRSPMPRPPSWGSARTTAAGRRGGAPRGRAHLALGRRAHDR